MGSHTGAFYREIPILDAARRCGLVLNSRTLEREEVEASCPFCGDNGPGKYHLSLNTRKNVYRCNLCNASGNSVSLFARLEGVSNRQAFQTLSEEGRLFRFPEQPLSKKPPEREPSSLSARHDTYYDMLSHLELSPKHKADLLARGLPEERIAQNMYRSLPVGEQPRRFLAGMLADFHNLVGIPGFYVDESGYWNIAGYSGLLVPYRDKSGSIQGMQVRLDDENNPERKYRWLSSRTRNFGTRSLSWIHVTGNIHAKTAYLTEGGLKGDVASFLDHDALFLCFAGVNAIGQLNETLKDFSLSEVVVALDMDKLMNWRVRDALEKIMALVSSIPGIRVRLMNWNATFKGVDDFYQARNYAASKGVNILDIPRDYMARLNLFEDFIELLEQNNQFSRRGHVPLSANSMFVVDDAKQREKMAAAFYSTVRKEIAEYEERATHLIQSGSQSPNILDRLVLRIRGLEQKRSYYEDILSRELTDLNDQFTSLRYLSEELQIRVRGLRAQKKAA